LPFGHVLGFFLGHAAIRPHISPNVILGLGAGGRATRLPAILTMFAIKRFRRDRIRADAFVFPRTTCDTAIGVRPMILAMCGRGKPCQCRLIATPI
jgi:hypothetical protein